MELNEKTVKSEVKYEGAILTVCHDTVLLPDGKNAGRDVIRHSGGVCVVPLTDDNEVIFVRQFRYPFGKVMTEIPAGKLNAGEDHYKCGVRELEEETGCTAESITYLGCLYPTPAYCSEITYMYLARGLKGGKQHLDEDEFLEVTKIPLDKAVEMIMNNEIDDAKTQLAILKTKFLIDSGK